MKKIIKPIAIALIAIFSMQMLTSCFGKFALTRIIYKFNDGLGGNDIGGRFIKTIVMWVMLIIPVYGIGSFIDIIILNLIEFWTGKNPLAMKAGESDTQFVTFKGNSYKMVATQGQMIVTILDGKNAGKSQTLYFNQDHTISILHEGQQVKVAQFAYNDYTMASINTSLQAN
ncbi:MAG: DUF3332 family protein [Cytophagales bacterium]|nr:DUF3332 family protein [Cytophagales bacterium]